MSETTRHADPAETCKDPITRDEAAALAGVNTRTIDRWANEERITRYKVGGLQWVRFERAEVLAMREPQPADSAE